MKRFQRALRESLQLDAYKKWRIAANMREELQRENDGNRPTIKWTSKINPLSRTQWQVLHRMVNLGWQVWGVIVHGEHYAVVLRTHDHDCWAILYENDSQADRQYTKRLTFNVRRDGWDLVHATPRMPQAHAKRGGPRAHTAGRSRA